MANDTDLREHVRIRYAEAASTVTLGAGAAQRLLSSRQDLRGGGPRHRPRVLRAPDRRTASRSCGACQPRMRQSNGSIADLHPGETVLDLGSGGGIDVLLSARRVGPTGKVYGLDMTEEMLALAIKNRRRGGRDERRVPEGLYRGYPASRELRRRRDLELRRQPVDGQASGVRRDPPGPPARRPPRNQRCCRRCRAHSTPELAERGTQVGCISGALTFQEYQDGLRSAGFVEVSITSTSEYLPGIHSAIVKASRSPQTRVKTSYVRYQRRCDRLVTQGDCAPREGRGLSGRRRRRPGHDRANRAWRGSSRHGSSQSPRTRTGEQRSPHSTTLPQGRSALHAPDQRGWT